MSKKIYNKSDWDTFRNEEIFTLIALYLQIKEFSKFNVNYINKIDSLFSLSKMNTICTFYIKCGLIMNNGKPYIKDFININDQNELKIFKDLNSFYKPIKNIRDHIYAHNLKFVKKFKYSISNVDIDNFYFKLIELAKIVDTKFGCNDYRYDLMSGVCGITSVENYIEKSIKYDKIKMYLLPNIKTEIKIDIQTGEIFTFDNNNNKIIF